MQCDGLVDYFENDTQRPWTFQLQFGIIHALDCTVCRSYMTHVAAANYSRNTSFKDALNDREGRVSTAFLDGFQSGQQVQREHDSSMLARYHDERNKALQRLDIAKKEMETLRVRVLALELTLVSGRGSKTSGSTTESSTKSGLSLMDRFLSEGQSYGDTISMPFLPAEDKEALQTDNKGISDPINVSARTFYGVRPGTLPNEQMPISPHLQHNPLLKPCSTAPKSPTLSPQSLTRSLSRGESSFPDQRSLSVEQFGEINVPVADGRKSWADLLKPSSPATQKPPTPLPQPPACAPNLSNPSFPDQHASSVEQLGETDVPVANVRKSWADLVKPRSSTTHQPPAPLPQPPACAPNLSNPSFPDQHSSYVEQLGETSVPVANVRKSWADLAMPSSSASHKLPTPSDQHSSYVEQLANVYKSWADLLKPPSATHKPPTPSSQPPECAPNLSNPSSSDKHSSHVETTDTVTNVRKSWADLLKPPAAIHKPLTPSSQPPACASSLSNPFSSDQQSSTVEPLKGNDVSNENVRKSWAQLASFATRKPVNPTPQTSTCELGLSDQPSSSVGLPRETNAASPNVRKSWAQLASFAARKPVQPSSQQSTCPLGLSNPSSDQHPEEINVNASSSYRMQMASSPTPPSQLLTRASGPSNPSTSELDQQSSSIQTMSFGQPTIMISLFSPPSVSNSTVSSPSLGSVRTLSDDMFSNEICVDEPALGTRLDA